MFPGELRNIVCGHLQYQVGHTLGYRLHGGVPFDVGCVVSCFSPRCLTVNSPFVFPILKCNGLMGRERHKKDYTKGNYMFNQMMKKVLIIVALVSMVALAGCAVSVDNGQETTTAPTTFSEPENVTDYYNQEKIDDGLSEQQTQILKSQGQFASTVKIQVAPKESAGIRDIDKSYMIDFVNDKQFSLVETEEGFTETFSSGPNVYQMSNTRGVVEYTSHSTEFNTDYPTIGLSPSTGEKYVYTDVGTYKREGVTTYKDETVAKYTLTSYSEVPELPYFESDKPLHVSSFNSTLYITENNVLRGAETTADVIYRGEKYDFSINYTLKENKPTISRPNWTDNAPSPECGSETSIDTDITKFGGEDMANVTVSSLGDETVVKLIQGGEELYEISQQGNGVGVAITEDRPVTIVAVEGTCETTLETVSVPEE